MSAGSGWFGCVRAPVRSFDRSRSDAHIHPPNNPRKQSVHQLKNTRVKTQTTQRTLTPQPNPTQPQQIGKAVLASNLPLDAPKHIFLMLFMLTDRLDPRSFFKVRGVFLCFGQTGGGGWE